MPESTTTGDPEIVTTPDGDVYQLRRIEHNHSGRLMHPSCAQEVVLADPSPRRIEKYVWLHDCDARGWWTHKV